MAQTALKFSRSMQHNNAVRALTSSVSRQVGERSGTGGVAAVNLPSAAELDRACRAMLPLLKRVAYRFAKRLPGHVEVDELVSAGSVGLVMAVRQHWEKPEPELKSLAVQRIRGAILDHLRATDYLTRRQRAAVAAVQKTKNELEKEGKSADIEVVAKKLGMSIKRAEQIEGRLASVQVSSLQGLDVAAENSPDAATEIIRRQFRDRVVLALGKLPERLQTLLSLYYFEELTYQEISRVMGISRSRICQLHTQAVTAMRKNLSALQA